MNICKVNFCKNKYWAKGYCSRHYDHIRLYGKILKRTRLTPNEFTIERNICRIVLYNINHVAIAETIIDTKNVEKCKKYKWWLSQGYVKTTRNGNCLFLHKFICNPPKNRLTDHIDRNMLNNLESNLRIATKSQNGANSKLQKNNTSGYRGVHWDKRNKRWVASVRNNYKKFYLGRFIDKHEAAFVYNKAAREFFGEFVTLNEVEELKEHI